ncbi:hypothetical protein BCR33DRAFT_527486 [Rhizoclosmatium globosum]|uniref:Uncharacterized protein n=1 Tax=Rhizoclosmatium globosum TaxID=329046 RepID=A0A1Y2CTG5_9FUNG|nr:hypothetical protein BCR33DRAFT_527486 [Rhizoclosmatium globosum]|eukprot:ORY50348.1 hypothetical protein BCR33DRAFT_527486 [Rhizoclosmatium globosum]
MLTSSDATSESLIAAVFTIESSADATGFPFDSATPFDTAAVSSSGWTKTGVATSWPVATTISRAVFQWNKSDVAHECNRDNEYFSHFLLLNHHLHLDRTTSPELHWLSVGVSRSKHLLIKQFSATCDIFVKGVFWDYRICGVFTKDLAEGIGAGAESWSWRGSKVMYVFGWFRFEAIWSLT